MDFKQGGEPLVSIVIPSYNAAQYLREAIDSILNQTYSNIELIVLDDGSADETRGILGSYPQSSLYWESHPNMGQSATLNKGWAMAKGSILSYLSADDSLLPNAVQLSVESLLRHGGVIMTYGDYMLMDENSNDIQRVHTPEFDYQQMVSDIIVQPGPGVFFYKAAFEEIGGWNPSYRQVPDLEYWLRLGLLGEFLRIPTVLAKFRVHDESQTYMEASVEKSEECVHVIENYFRMESLPSEVRTLERQSKASAHLFTARMHLRAGRYLGVINHLKAILYMRPATLLSKHAIRMIGNALLFRLKQRAN